MENMQLDFIDIHYHAMPDLYVRKYNVFDVGKKYSQLKGAVVLKSHLGSTSVQASLAQIQGLPVFPSIVLNRFSGGIDYRNVLQALSEYNPIFPSKMIVHFPTITGRKHKSRLSREFSNKNISQIALEPETISDNNGNVRKEVIDILKMSKDYPIIVSSGHASKQEVYGLIDQCVKYDIEHLFLNQPANPMTGLDAAELRELNKYPFVWSEQTALTYLLNYQDEEDFKSVLKDVSNVIYSSDLGQTSQMDIDQWLNQSTKWFNKFGITKERRDKICLMNPLQLLAV
jgi:hypothetical protein